MLCLARLSAACSTLTLTLTLLLASGSRLCVPNKRGNANEKRSSSINSKGDNRQYFSKTSKSKRRLHTRTHAHTRITASWAYSFSSLVLSDTMTGPTLSPESLLCVMWLPSQLGNVLDRQHRHNTHLPFSRVILSTTFCSDFLISGLIGLVVSLRWKRDGNGITFKPGTNAFVNDRRQKNASEVTIDLC